MRKLLLVLVLLGAVSSVYAEKGEMSYIPKLKTGASIIDLEYGSLSYSEAEPTVGLGIDILYSFTDRFEAGVGMSIEKNYITKTLGDLTEGSEDIIFGQLFVTGRYNFINSSNFTPFIQAKAGVAKGDETFNYMGHSLEVEPTMVYGISTGVEYKNVNLELGYEVVEVDLTAGGAGEYVAISGTEEEEIQTIYLAVGYRF